MLEAAQLQYGQSLFMVYNLFTTKAQKVSIWIVEESPGFILPKFCSVDH